RNIEGQGGCIGRYSFHLRQQPAQRLDYLGATVLSGQGNGRRHDTLARTEKPILEQTENMARAKPFSTACCAMARFLSPPRHPRASPMTENAAPCHLVRKMLPAEATDLNEIPGQSARTDAARPEQAVAFSEAVRVWVRIALLSFGGPAGQMAVMHRILVEEKRWIGE